MDGRAGPTSQGGRDVAGTHLVESPRKHRLGVMRGRGTPEAGSALSRAKSRPVFDRPGLQGGDVAEVEIFDHNSPRGEQHRCERPNTKFDPRRVGRSASGAEH
jgi:hypothetical protein